MLNGSLLPLNSPVNQILLMAKKVTTHLFSPNKNHSTPPKAHHMEKNIVSTPNTDDQEGKVKQLQAAAASMAHEFRHPLAAVKLAVTQYKQFLARLQVNHSTSAAHQSNVNQGSAIHHEDIEKEQQHLEKLLKIIDNSNALLTLQLQNIRSEQQIQPQYFANHSLQHCLTHAIQTFPFKKTEQQALIHINVFEDFSFWGDTTLLIHTLWNLLHNALYFIDAEQRGEIFITHTQTSDHFLLHFKDTAKGMSGDEARDIFQPFYTKRHEGTGLGLYFCSHVMAAFQGFITCKAKPGQYAEFILGFPKKKAYKCEAELEYSLYDVPSLISACQKTPSCLTQRAF